MTGPWDLTGPQRQQFREAHAGVTRARMQAGEKRRTAGETGFGDWDLSRLTALRDHLQSILLVSAGQPGRPQVREEYGAVCAEIAERAQED
jgi:hypothetical protein